MYDVLLPVICLVLVFMLFALFHFLHGRRQEQNRKLRGEIESVVREVMNEYGRIIVREEIRKVHNENLMPFEKKA